MLDDATGVTHRCEREEEVYSLLGLEWIPPELRENRGELAAAADGTLPALVTAEDLRGDLHCHTDASDGTASIAEMARAAAAAGYEYLAITDHSTSVGARIEGEGLQRAHRADPRRCRGPTRPAGSRCSPAQRSTSCPTARSTTPTRCSPSSTGWSPRCTPR